MTKLITIGEALIDFIPSEKGCGLKDVNHFYKAPGGAPANVAACVARLGGQSTFISQLGEDAFGDFLIETLEDVGVETTYIKRTNAAKTGLAFVSLKEDGQRDFSFYRQPSADLLFTKDDLDKDLFQKNNILHFCSVDLIESPMKYAHLQAIHYAQDANMLISFDPNVRLPLWDDPDLCKSTIAHFTPYVDILKISDDELPFITGRNLTSCADEDEALHSLFQGHVKLILYTKGKEGVRLLLKSGYDITVQSKEVNVVDTTGAGDSFIGAFLYQLQKNSISKTDLLNLSVEKLTCYLKYATHCAALVISKKGVISALPTENDLLTFMS